MSNEQLRFPQAYLAMGNGDLIQVTDFNVSFGNGGKQVHTLRVKDAGHTLGNPECSATFNSVISENGPERNYWRDVKRGTVRQLRAKIPGGRTTLTITGIFTAANTDGPLDDATKIACTFIGALDEPEV
jgi:hypothetical protein